MNRSPEPGKGRLLIWSGGLLGLDGLVDDAHDVGFLHDQQVLAVDLDLGARPFAEQDEVAGLDVEWDKRAVFVACTRSTAMTSPSCGFSLALSGMMMPPFDLISPSARRMTTRSWSGRNFMRLLSGAGMGGHAPSL